MKKLDFPNRITVELTNQCNVSCTFCPRQSVDMKIGFMSMELYKKIIDEASDHLPVKLVIFFRGESLLHPEFIECVKYAKDKGIGPIQYATNAFELTNDMADKLLENGIDFISFSLDTLDPEIYRKSRLCGNLDISRDNVIYLSKKCDEKRKKGLQVPTLQVSTVEIEEYMPEQGKFIEFWKKYVDIVRVYYEHDDNGKFRNVEVQRLLEEEVPERKPCRKLFTDLLVYWDGQLALCNYDWRGGLQGLNLNKMTIEEAWNSKLYEQLREAHNNGEIADDIMCQNCQHWRIDYMQNGYLGKLYTRRA
mgnify:FL=1